MHLPLTAAFSLAGLVPLAACFPLPPTHVPPRSSSEGELVKRMGPERGQGLMLAHSLPPPRRPTSQSALQPLSILPTIDEASSSSHTYHGLSPPHGLDVHTHGRPQGPPAVRMQGSASQIKARKHLDSMKESERGLDRFHHNLAQIPHQQAADFAHHIKEGAKTMYSMATGRALTDERGNILNPIFHHSHLSQHVLESARHGTNYIFTRVGSFPFAALNGAVVRAGQAGHAVAYAGNMALHHGARASAAIKKCWQAGCKKVASRFKPSSMTKGKEGIDRDIESQDGGIELQSTHVKEIKGTKS